MNDERNDLNEDMSDEEMATKAKELLGAAVAAAPAAPSVADIESRIAARTGVAGALPGSSEAPATAGAAPAVDTAQRSAEAEDDHDLAAYVTPAPSSNGGARPGSRWPRVVLAAAAIVAMVALGVAMIDRGDSEQETIDQAESPELAEGVVGVLPTTPPEGQVLTWIGDYSVAEGKGTMLRYHGYSGRESLTITSTVWNQQPLSATGASTTTVEGVASAESVGGSNDSLNVRMGDRDVLLSDEGRNARFVGPVGMVVEVTGEPDDVAAVVPTLETVASEQWRSFIDEMSADIAALPETAAYEVTTGGPEGVDIEGVDRLRLSVHAHAESTSLSPLPVGGIGNRSGAVAGTCLTVDGNSTCRPGDPGPDLASDHLRTSNDVLIDGDWWQFGWATDELTSYTIEPDTGGEVEAFWYYEGTGHGDSMTWFAARIPDEAREVTVELGGSGGFGQRRPVR